LQYEGVLISPWPDQKGNKLQRPNSGFIQRVSMLLKSRASHDMFPFSLCNKKRLAIRHMNRPVFPATT
jgi:hypothetical protein